MEFTTTAEAGQAAGINVCIYGPAGTGKTHIIGTAPTPVIISAERGLMPLRGVEIPVMSVSTYADCLLAYQYLAHDPAFQHFETICIDSLSEMAEALLAEELPKHKNPMQAYGEVINKTLNLCRWFRDLHQFNVYFSAKQEREKDEGTGMMLYGPSMPGKKLGPQISYLFDLVFNAQATRDELGQTHYALLTKGNAQYVAKDRSGVLPELQEPNLTTIFNTIRGSIA